MQRLQVSGAVRHIYIYTYIYICIYVVRRQKVNCSEQEITVNFNKQTVWFLNCGEIYTYSRAPVPTGTVVPRIHWYSRAPVSTGTFVPPYPLVQYLRLQLPAVHRGTKKVWKIKKINGP
jgi:hypothetical protein